MSETNGTGVTGGHPSLAGAVLAAIRRHVGLTQQGLADAMQRSSVKTIQGWESGRRPLTRLTFEELDQLQRVLTLATASSNYLAVLNDALKADRIVAQLDTTDPRAHPLATVVPNRTLTELLAWPMTGQPPRQLADLQPQLHVPSGYRDHLAAALRRAADQAGRDVAGAMVRRQAHYLAASHAPSAGWLAESVAADLRAAPDLREWSPDWPAVRSRAIVAATRGDHEPMQQFLERGLSSDQAITANLVYWAYWTGEISWAWSSDADMLANSQPWSGELLLGSLLDGLAAAPYRELCAHALHALLKVRRGLVDRHRDQIITTIDYVTSTYELSRDTTNRLDQIAYAHRS